MWNAEMHRSLQTRSEQINYIAQNSQVLVADSLQKK